LRFNDVGLDAFRKTIQEYEQRFGITSSLFYKLTRQGIPVIDDVLVESDWLTCYVWVQEGQNGSRPSSGQAGKSKGGVSPLLHRPC
jgi:hypothetical protein